MTLEKLQKAKRAELVAYLHSKGFTIYVFENTEQLRLSAIMRFKMDALIGVKIPEPQFNERLCEMMQNRRDTK